MCRAIADAAGKFVRSDLTTAIRRLIRASEWMPLAVRRLRIAHPVSLSVAAVARDTFRLSSGW